MDNCIFCKIIANEIPSHKVYEDENVLAFLDIAPVNPGHTLVVPKKHYANLEEISADELCLVIKAVKKVGQAIKSGLKAPGYNIAVNNDPVAGQVVPHLHFHLIPRKEGDGHQLWQQGKYNEDEAENIVNKLKDKL